MAHMGIVARTCPRFRGAPFLRRREILRNARHSVRHMIEARAWGRQGRGTASEGQARKARESGLRIVEGRAFRAICGLDPRRRAP